jgi:hypothetical protein
MKHLSPQAEKSMVGDASDLDNRPADGQAHDDLSLFSMSSRRLILQLPDLTTSED